LDTVLRYVPETVAGPILDLYAGVGLFAAPLARRGHRVVAVEENRHAVEDAIETLKLNRISGCRFLSGRVETVLKKMVHRESFEAVILDPPREGCPEWLLRMVARQIRPTRIIDVSCDPVALSCDLALLTRCGYRVMEVQPIDMFPHTPHIESVALLQRSAPAASSRG
jgi:23S rRNA (uracil1939-C5)-methyltransferase